MVKIRREFLEMDRKTNGLITRRALQRYIKSSVDHETKWLLWLEREANFKLANTENAGREGLGFREYSRAMTFKYSAAPQKGKEDLIVNLRGFQSMFGQSLTRSTAAFERHSVVSFRDFLCAVRTKGEELYWSREQCKKAKAKPAAENPEIASQGKGNHNAAHRAGACVASLVVVFHPICWK